MESKVNVDLLGEGLDEELVVNEVLRLLPRLAVHDSLRADLLGVGVNRPVHDVELGKVVAADEKRQQLQFELDLVQRHDVEPGLDLPAQVEVLGLVVEE